MKPVESVKTCFRKYTDFNGRAGRTEFWWFFLFIAIVFTATRRIPVLDIHIIIPLLLLLPSLAVTVRRLHDTGRSAMCLLIYLGVFLSWTIGLIIPFVYVEIFPEPQRPPSPYLTRNSIILLYYAVVYYIVCLWISMAGALTMIILCIQQGTVGPNRYGPDPRQREAGIAGYGGAASPESDGQQHCPQCGAERASADARFCTDCGIAF